MAQTARTASQRPCGSSAAFANTIGPTSRSDSSCQASIDSCSITSIRRAATLMLAAQGNLRTTTMRAFSADEMRALIAKTT